MSAIDLSELDRINAELALASESASAVYEPDPSELASPASSALDSLVHLIQSAPAGSEGNQSQIQESPLAVPEIQWANIDRRVQGAGGKYAEMLFAAELAGILPRLATTGTLWRLWSGRQWEAIPGPERFHPLALSLLARFGHATAQRARDIIAHVGGAHQTTGQPWRGAYAFDNDGSVLLNLSNGILRITRTMIEIGPHDWQQCFTLAIPTPWVPDAECPAFQATLHAAMPDPADRELFRLFAGSILLPSSRLEAGLSVFGPSGTGKSTLVDAGIAATIGGPTDGTVTRITLRQLCDPKSYSLPGLEYSLVNIITECDALEVEESTNFKTIISGEPLECREIYGKPRIITTTAKLLLATNALPRFRNGTDAEGRRLRLLNFDQVPGRPDPSLKDRIHAEAPGILRWMALALQDVLALRQLPIGGASAKRVTDRFALSNDALGCFITSECEMDAATHIGRDELLGAFNEFADSHGFSPDNHVWFFRKLFDRYSHLKSAKRGGIRSIIGINLKSPSREG